MASKPKTKGEQKPAIEVAATPLSNESKTIHTPQKEPFRFGPGNTFGKGRPKGSKDKLSMAFVSALSDDFETHGVKVIEEVRLDKPVEYLKIVASLVPKDYNVNTNNVGLLSDDDLAERINSIDAYVAHVLGGSSGGTATASNNGGIPSGKTKPH